MVFPGGSRVFLFREDSLWCGRSAVVSRNAASAAIRAELLEFTCARGLSVPLAAAGAGFPAARFRASARPRKTSAEKLAE